MKIKTIISAAIFLAVPFISSELKAQCVVAGTPMVCFSDPGTWEQGPTSVLCGYGNGKNNTSITYQVGLYSPPITIYMPTIASGTSGSMSVANGPIQSSHLIEYSVTDCVLTIDASSWTAYYDSCEGLVPSGGACPPPQG